MSQKIEEKIKHIQEQLQLLCRQYAVLAKENESLQQLLAEARQATQKAAEEAADLQQQIQINKYTQAQMLPEEKKAFEKKITAYIKEIDKCIALLSV